MTNITFPVMLESSLSRFVLKLALIITIKVMFNKKTFIRRYGKMKFLGRGIIKGSWHLFANSLFH